MVALDQLQAAVARVALELDVAEPAQAHALEEAQAQLRHLRVPVGDVEAAGAEPDRVLAQLALRDVQERLALLVDVAVVGEELVVARRG